MAVDVRAWNLGSFVVLAAGCGSAVVPAGDADTSGDEASSLTEPSSESAPPPPQCEDDDDCFPDYACREGRCEYDYQCSTCCDYECSGSDPDSGGYGYECESDLDCGEGDICLDRTCVTGPALAECPDGALAVEPLPIPVGDHATNLAFVDGAEGERDRLVLVDESRVAVVAADGMPAWSAAPMQTQSPRRILVADFDDDGSEDVALTGIQDDVGGIATFAIADGSPSFVRFSPGEGESPDVGDFDGDGHPDVLQWTALQGYVVSAGLGDGSFAAPVSIGLGEPWASVGDVDGDGRDELITDTGEMFSFGADFQLSQIGQLEPAEPDLGMVSLRVTDLDGDGSREILTARGWPGTWIERADPSGAFVHALLVPGASTLAGAADLAGDGVLALALDIAVVRAPLDEACLLTHAESGSVRLLAVGDYDGDTGDDIVMLREADFAFAIARLPPGG
jgi:hypothetical protein